jgi:hypothetical protein
MSTEENKAAEHRMTEEVWNQRNFDTVDELVAPDVVEHNPVLPGQAQASSTPAPWPGWTYPPHGVQPVVVVPGSPTHAARVRRILGDRVTVVSSAGAQAHLAAGLHRTLLLQHSGIMLVDSAGVVRYRLATALPTGSFDGPTLQAAIDRL